VYTDGIVWVGKVQDGRSPVLRTGGGIYQVGTVPGAILQKGVAENPESPTARIYRIRKDYASADLRLDAAEVFNKPVEAVTPEMIDAVRRQYERDWKEWPWQKGAPFYDENGNGVMDAGEIPGLEEADQVIWFAYNDLDESVSKAFYGAPSTGIETQVTLWGYRGVPEFENVIFKRYRFIFKGAASTPPKAVIDSMYVSQWTDVDVGDFSDDLGGCDSSLSLGFAFSTTNPDRAFRSYGWQNPAVGYAILQGPAIPASESDEGLFDFKVRRGIKNLPMTSFLLNATGDPISEPPYGTPTYWYWNVARGFTPLPADRESTIPWITQSGEVTKFPYSGDPVDRSGWIDGVVKSWFSQPGWGYSFAPGERRLMLNTGPFRMALGDTQEVVIALVAGMGADGRQSTRVIKYATKVIRTIYPSLAERVREVREKEKAQAPVEVPKEFFLSQNYPNPFNPGTRIEYSIPFDANVRLAIHDVLGREIVVLEDGSKRAGTYKLEWNGRDHSGRELPSGVYFYKLQAGHLELTRKLVIVR